MTLKNLLNLRPQKEPKVIVIEKEILAPRSIKFELLRILLVIGVVFAITLGISRADTTPSEDVSTATPVVTVPEEIPETTTVPEETPVVIVPTETSTTETIQEATTTTTDATTTSIIENITDTVTDIGNQVKDTVTNTIDKVSDIITGTSTEEITATTTPTNLEQATSTTNIEITEQDTDSGKLVTVSAPNEDPNTPITNVIASTTIPKIYKVGEEDKIQIKWKNEGGQEMAFQATDTNGDGYLDLIQWIVPHLSTQTFEIIFISKAFQLDSNLNILADIYDTVKTKDGNFASLSNGQYIRATFDQILDNTKDNTIFAKSSDSNASIEVYPVYKDQAGNLIEGPRVATFENITDAKTYKVLLTDLKYPTDIFDLKINGNIDIDFIVDPTVYIWLGGNEDNGFSVDSWDNPANWQGGVLPPSGANVEIGVDATANAVIPIGYSNDESGGVTLGDLTIDSPIDAYLGNYSTINDITGTVIITSGAGIFNDGGTITNISGTINNSGSYGIYNNYGTITNISGTINNTGTGNGIQNYGTVTITSTTTTITNTGGGFGFYNEATVNGAGTINGDIFVEWNGTLDLSSGLTITGTITNNGTITPVSDPSVCTALGKTLAKDNLGDAMCIPAEPQPFASGSGTKVDPWIVSTCQQLQKIGSYGQYLSDYFKLQPAEGNTIDCSDTINWNSGKGFRPIGDFFNRFMGTFDGQNNKISNLYINRPSTNNVGLFGVIDEGGLVKKLGLENVTITGLQYIGAMAGSLSGRIENSYATGAVNGGYEVGGLVGYHVSPDSLSNSSPLVYTWNGSKYTYVADIGKMTPRNNSGLDLASIDSNNLVPKGDKYSMKISEEYNEIVYFDELALMTYDHQPGYTVVSPLNGNAKIENLRTISDTPTNPLVGCADMYGNDCVDSLKAYDDKWSYKDKSFVNSWVLDFGDLSNKDNIQLVMRGARDYEAGASGEYEKMRNVEVKDANGNWVTIYDKNSLGSDGTPRLRTIDLTGKFLSNDYHVKVTFGTLNVNYFAVDTSPQVPVTVHKYHPTKANLQFQGFTDIDKTYYFNHDYSKISPTPKENFANQYGNFTKYGDVSPLLQSTNDQFVVMRYGDAMDIEFPYEAVPEGQERSFILYNDALYKHAANDNIGLLGRTVNPLPYQGMTGYSKDTTYPMTPENAEYLKTWNTRTYKGTSKIGGSTILDSHADVDVTGSNVTGGLVGYNYKAIIRSYATGNVAGGNQTGGLVGLNYPGGTITDSYSTGSVSAAGYVYIGGLVGLEYGKITSSYSSSPVTGNDYVGGLLGYYVYGYNSVDSSYSIGSVEGDGYVGGVVGGDHSLANSGWVVQEGLNPIGTDPEATVTYNETTADPFFSKTHGVYTAGTNKWDFNTVWQENVGALPTLRPYDPNLYRWVGGNTDNGFNADSWDNPANWQGGELPPAGANISIGSDATTNATIPEGYSNDTHGGVTIGNLTINNTNYYYLINNGTITDITGTSTMTGGGEAVSIYNYGTITDISGNFTNNGDADNIRNNGTITNISGTITNNGIGFGIINDGTITDISGTITNNGGGIGFSGVVTDISGTINNTGSGKGISNYTTITNISGTVNNTGFGTGIYISNSSTITDITGVINNIGTGGLGINNQGGNITNISGTFNNSSDGSGECLGIYNFGGTLTNFSGTFNNGSNCVGIQTYDSSLITDISGTFINDSAYQGIYNQNGGIITDISGTVTNGVNGWAGIYNDGTITNISGTINSLCEGECGGIYNNSGGAITDISGTINNTGSGSAGIYNYSGATITNISGIVNNSGYFGLYNGSTITDITGTVVNSGTNYGIYNYGDGIITIDGTIYNFLGVTNFGLESTVIAPGSLVNLPVTDGKIWTNASSTNQNNWDNPDNWLLKVPANKTTDNIILGEADMTLPSDITGDVYFATDGIALDEAGYQIIGNIYGVSGSDELGVNGVNVAQKGFDISILNASTTGNIVGGSGGFASVGINGDGGNIAISGTNLDFSGKDINGGSGGTAGDSSVYGGNGTLTLTYQGLTTDTSTHLYNIGALVINNKTGYIDTSGNSTSCDNGVPVGVGCAWNGVFNPLIFYFKNSVDTNWNTVGNWWNDVNYSVQASSTPLGYSQVFVNGEITTGTDAIAGVIIFTGTSSSAIDIDVSGNAEFKDQSTNLGTTTSPFVSFFNSSSNAGRIVSDVVTFWENLTGNSGGGTVATSTINGIIQRIFTADATTTRDFTSEGGRSDWIIETRGAIVSLWNGISGIAGALYDTAHNIFKALAGGYFISNPTINGGAHVTPIIAVDLGLEGTGNQIIKWDPVIDWDTAMTCMYSYDNFVSTTTISCGSGHANIPRPAPNVTKTLSLRGIDSNGYISEKPITYQYKNDVAIPTYCGTDFLDEVTRPNYYLISSTSTSCTATVNTKLYGNPETTSTSTSGVGFSIGSFEGNGHTITLKNITVVGTTTSNGANLTIQNATTSDLVTTATTSGATAGSITVQNSNVHALISNGATNGSGAGGRGGTITIATSTTAAIVANGADGTTNGGTGGNIIITNSLGNPLTSPIFANGGNSTSCGDGGDAGNVDLTNSSYGTITNLEGQGQNSGCPLVSHINGAHRHPIVTGVHSSQIPSSSPSAPSNTTSGGSLLRRLFNTTLNPLYLTPITGTNILGPDFNPQNVGATLLPNPLANLQPFKKIDFSDLPSKFLKNISQFLFSPMQPITNLLGKTPALAKYMASITANSPLISPIQIPQTDTPPPGLFLISSNGTPLTTYAIKDDTVGGIAELVKTTPNQSITISLIPLSTGEVSASFNNKTVLFTKGTTYATLNTITPETNGRYILKTSSSPMPLVIEVYGTMKISPEDKTKPWKTFNWVWNVFK